uniref:(northern house mosquito) hypothetical protein n=1 Tax=Culex pipiens TaxID=7175 RepID=A0A8D8F905_CULPI
MPSMRGTISCARLTIRVRSHINRWQGCQLRTGMPWRSCGRAGSRLRPSRRLMGSTRSIRKRDRWDREIRRDRKMRRTRRAMIFPRKPTGTGPGHIWRSRRTRGRTWTAIGTTRGSLRRFCRMIWWGICSN